MPDNGKAVKKKKKASESKESTWEVRLSCFLACISAKLSRLFRHNWF